MTHSHDSDLKQTFPHTVRPTSETAIYWDKDIRFVGLRVEPDGTKTWMVHDWCAGCREVGDYPTAIPNFNAACRMAGEMLTDQLKELVNIVIDNKLPISIAKDAVDALTKLINRP
jgi:hypothetical protein